MLKENEIYNMDCIEAMKQIDDGVVDLVFVDLPYGITSQNSWDTVIPFDVMWEQIHRIIKYNGVVVLFGQGLFTVNLIKSNEKEYRYTIIWNKVLTSGFLNAKKRPLSVHEDLVVFYKKSPTYNPQKVKGKPNHTKGKAVGKANSDVYANNNYRDFVLVENVDDMHYPTSIWEYCKPHPSIALHPTQKPIDLCRNVIRTYSNEGELVLDFCCGSGSIPLAAKLENRRYIGVDNGICEKSKSENKGKYWADIARERIEKESKIEEN